jgi:hypothetical protein
MLKEFFTRNLSLKLTASVLAVVLWLIARYWLVR